MKELYPYIVVAGIADENSARMKKILTMVEKKFLEMGIRVFFMPENFSLEESQEYVLDITDSKDFFLNFTFAEKLEIFYKSEAEKELAEIFRVQSTRRSDEEYAPAQVFPDESSQTIAFLKNLPLHSYQIEFSPHKSDAEIKMNIMACITDICFIPNNLVQEKDRWAFRDVPSYHFAAQSIKKAKEKKIIPGYKGDVIYPNGGITRGEIIYMLDKIGSL